MEVFKVHHASDDKIILESDKQLETLFKEISNDQNFIVQWNENNEAKTKLFIGDGLLSRLKDGRLVLEAKKALDKSHEDYDADLEEEAEAVMNYLARPNDLGLSALDLEKFKKTKPTKKPNVPAVQEVKEDTQEKTGKDTNGKRKRY